MVAQASYLPYINNFKHHSRFTQYKNRFSALNRIHIVKFEIDSVIFPPESAHFGYRDEHNKAIKPKDTGLYTKDTIGLKTLDKSGRATWEVLQGLDHLQ